MICVCSTGDSRAVNHQATNVITGRRLHITSRDQQDPSTGAYAANSENPDPGGGPMIRPLHTCVKLHYLDEDSSS